MPLNVQSIATCFAVICFFAIAIIGGITGISSFTCSKRAMIGAIIAYIAATLTVRSINAILMNAMITREMEKHKEEKIGATK